jgi:hypothetical protein
MRIIPIFLLLTLGLTASIQIANAQPAPPNPPAGQPKLISGLPVESVTVVATKPSDAAIKNFVETRAMPTRVLNKMARWTMKICPQTIGLGDKYAIYITQRIRDIASAVGAPVNADPACRPNIEVVFTTAPQGLMDIVHKSTPQFLGYHDNSHQADELATVTHPIQAWYSTESLDWDGSRQIESGTCSGGPKVNYADAAGAVHQLEFPCAFATHAIGGTRLNDALNSGFFNVLIVAEPAKLFDYEVGSLADYITMMALSQPASLDSCQELPSISNMLAKGCASTTNRITDGDLSYLHALYKLLAGESMAVQRDEMRYEMKKTLVPPFQGR